MSLAAYKSLVSHYSLRAKQSEDMVRLLMSDKIPKEIYETAIVNKVQAHIETRGVERSTQYLGLLQTTLLALTNIRNNVSDIEKTDKDLLEVIKALTVAVN